MSFPVFITLAMLATGAFLIVRAWRQRVIEQRLRDNPAERALFEVRLPGEVNDSVARMDRFYRKLGQVVMTDRTLRREGRGVVSVVFYAEVPEGKSSPEIRCIIYCPPEHLALVKRGLSQVYGGLAEIVTPDEDPIAVATRAWISQERPVEPADASDQQVPA